MQTVKDYDSLLNKVERVTKQKKLDLSAGEDLSIAIMNLISIEEHLFFTSQKTGDQSYLELLSDIRLMRTKLLKEIIKDYEGEVWCISKHLLSASMRLMEVGTKELKKKNKKIASEYFDKSYKLYSLFWGLNLDIVKSNDLNYKKVKRGQAKEKVDEKVKLSIFDKLSGILQKAVDCCKE